MSTELSLWVEAHRNAATAGETLPGDDAAAHRGEALGALPEIPGAWVDARVCDEEDREYTERWYGLAATHEISFRWDKKGDLEQVFDQVCVAIGQIFRRMPDAPAVLDLNSDYLLLRRDESSIVLDSEDDFWTEQRRCLLGSPYRLAPLNSDS